MLLIGVVRRAAVLANQVSSLCSIQCVERGAAIFFHDGLLQSAERSRTNQLLPFTFSVFGNIYADLHAEYRARVFLFKVHHLKTREGLILEF